MLILEVHLLDFPNIVKGSAARVHSIATTRPRERRRWVVFLRFRGHWTAARTLAQLRRRLHRRRPRGGALPRDATRRFRAPAAFQPPEGREVRGPILKAMQMVLFNIYGESAFPDFNPGAPRKWRRRHATRRDASRDAYAIPRKPLAQDHQLVHGLLAPHSRLRALHVAQDRTKVILRPDKTVVRSRTTSGRR